MSTFIFNAAQRGFYACTPSESFYPAGFVPEMIIGLICILF